MRTFNHLLFLLGLGLLLTSCQKENDEAPPSNDKLLGTWNVIAMNAQVKHMLVAGTGAEQEKLVTSYPISALNPKGTITFDATTLRTNGFSYSYKTIVRTEYYLGNALVFDEDVPQEGDIPPSNATTNYSIVAADSILLETGLISFDPAAGGTGGTNQTPPQGFKISWDNDVLVLTSRLNYAGTQPIAGGGTAQVLIDGVQILRLKK
jgi:hypothetical protein